MKKLGILLLSVFLLTGCGAQPTLETIADEAVQPVSATAQQILLELPEEVGTPAMQSSEAGAIYLCDGYTVTLNTVTSGDLNKTLYEATGFTKDGLQLMQTGSADLKRYECVWAAAGEPEEQVGRLCILDDGNYHYVLTAMADASQTGKLRQTWNTLFDSFRLVSPEFEVNTGS